METVRPHDQTRHYEEDSNWPSRVNTGTLLLTKSAGDNWSKNVQASLNTRVRVIKKTGQQYNKQVA